MAAVIYLPSYDQQEQLDSEMHEIIFCKIPFNIISVIECQGSLNFHQLKMSYSVLFHREDFKFIKELIFGLFLQAADFYLNRYFFCACMYMHDGTVARTDDRLMF